MTRKSRTEHCGVTTQKPQNNRQYKCLVHDVRDNINYENTPMTRSSHMMSNIHRHMLCTWLMTELADDCCWHGGASMCVLLHVHDAMTRWVWCGGWVSLAWCEGDQDGHDTRPWHAPRCATWLQLLNAMPLPVHGGARDVPVRMMGACPGQIESSGCMCAFKGSWTTRLEAVYALVCQRAYLPATSQALSSYPLTYQRPVPGASVDAALTTGAPGAT